MTMKMNEVSVNQLIQGKHYWVLRPGLIDRIYYADLDTKRKEWRLKGIGDRDITKLSKGTLIYGPIPEVKRA